MQDSNENITRFFLVTAGRRQAAPEAKPREMRSLIHLVIGNRPGALLHVLAPFDAAGVNLTFIQSRPLVGRPWEYGFFIEAATDWHSAAAEAAWRLVLALSESGRRIGTYPVR
jgi:prephenate dehydratase